MWVGIVGHAKKKKEERKSVVIDKMIYWKIEHALYI